LEHLANTSFMASFQAKIESLSGLSLWAFILLPCPTQYLAVYFSGSGFTPYAFLLSGWLLTNVQVNNITMLHDICAHMYIHHISITILLSFLDIFHSSWQTGWYRLFLSDTVRSKHRQIHIRNKSLWKKLFFDYDINLVWLLADIIAFGQFFPALSLSELCIKEIYIYIIRFLVCFGNFFLSEITAMDQRILLFPGPCTFIAVPPRGFRHFSNLLQITFQFPFRFSTGT
jgi:hypothetical protein